MAKTEIADVVELVESVRDDADTLHERLEIGPLDADRGQIRHDVRLIEGCLSDILKLLVASWPEALRDDQTRLLTDQRRRR